MNSLGVPDAAVLRDLEGQDFGRDITSPVDLLDRDLSQAEIDLVDRGRRGPGDPATYGDVIKLAARLIRREVTDNANRKLEQVNPPVVSYDDRITQLERDMAPIRRLGRWAMGVAAGAMLTVGVFLYSRGFSEGGAAARFEGLSRIVDELRGTVRALEQRRSSISPAVSPDAISSAAIKDTP